MKHKTIIEHMSLADKVALCSGASNFTTKAFEKYGIPSLRMADGPHGLRVQLDEADQTGLNRSLPATCFPTASLSACSWDRDLLREMGAAIGAEAQQAGVSVVLGPGANIKRNPLCGRNFEYFSEDPYLSGELAASWIHGLQSQGVGASLKHFAANSQETERFSSDSLVDERTLRELYLPAFEHAVKTARPATVMCAYNKLNGIYCSDNRSLLREVLRDEWGFTGVVVTDWGALNDRLKAFEAGLDLEMPASQGHFDQDVIDAVRSGALPEARLDESVDRLLDLIFTAHAARKPEPRVDPHAHHLLAKRIAASSAVLLKNEGNILPIQKGLKIALIGALAQEPRYQGAGSSHINPSKLSSVVDGFDALGLEYTYFRGYPLTGPGDEELVEQAVAGARGSDIAVILAGLPEAYESEGFDRESLALPASQDALIAGVAGANPNTVVVLIGGAPVEMPWIGQVKALLNLYLGGQAGGLAAAELLAGVANPSGKLAESYPLAYADVPSAGFYETGGRQAQYREGIYVGYRYYDTARRDVLFPFGHGLSYTTFEYSDLALSQVELDPPYALTFSVTVRNTGQVDGAEVVQVYVSQSDPPVFRPAQELKGFARVSLKAGESKQLTFSLDSRSFAIYDPQARDWVVPGGVYQVLVGASSRDLRLRGAVTVHGQPPAPPPRALSPWYTQPTGEVTQADFETLLGRVIEPVQVYRKGTYTLDCTFQDMRGSFVIRQMIKKIETMIAKGLGSADTSNPTYKMMVESAMTTPLKRLSQLAPQGMPRYVTIALVQLANGKYLQGLLTLVRKPKNLKAEIEQDEQDTQDIRLI